MTPSKYEFTDNATTPRYAFIEGLYDCHGKEKEKSSEEAGEQNSQRNRCASGHLPKEHQQGDKQVFNYAMPVPDYTIPKALKSAERLRVTCDVHPWMRAWVDVLPTTAFAVTFCQVSPPFRVR